MTEKLSAPHYHTPENIAISAWARLLGPTIPFYTGAAYEIFRALFTVRRGRFNRERWIEHSKNILDLVERVGGRLEIEHLDRVYDDPRPTVFVANHMSTLETFILPYLVGAAKPISFVVKESLLRRRAFGPVLRSTEPIAVTRANPRADLKAVLEQGEALLNRGVSVCLFPQQTRSEVFEPNKFNSLGEKLARRAGVPVLPIATKSDFWSTGRWIRDVGRIRPERTIHLSFGEPASARDAPRDTHERNVQFIAEKLASWGAACEQ